MLSFDSINLDIEKILLAHECVLNDRNKCAYPNGRRSYGLVYCIDGEGEYRFYDGKVLRIKSGDVIWFGPEASYSVVNKKDFTHYTVNFDVNKETSTLGFLSENFYIFNTKESQLIYHSFKKLISVWLTRNPCYKMQTKACLYELISMLVLGEIESQSNKVLYTRLRPAMEYIEQNYNKEITLDFLAGYVNMSAAHFRREWLKLRGESAMQYRDKLRLSFAKQYLMSGYYTVTEVAEKCGFYDVNYFIRFFKKHTGMSPGKFMKMP